MIRPEKKEYVKGNCQSLNSDEYIAGKIAGFNECHDDHTPYIEWLENMVKDDAKFLNKTIHDRLEK